MTAPDSAPQPDREPLGTPGQSPPIVPVVLVSPVRDEAKLIRFTLESIVAQSVRPVEWVIVDDGSTDDTRDVVLEYAGKHPFIRLVSRPDRGHRKLGGGVIAAFKFGQSQIRTQRYEYIGKLDGDLSFGPRYLEKMLEKFREDSTLAAVSGKVFREEYGTLVEESIIDDHVAGNFKLYRCAAFSDIGGFVQDVGWDTIDTHTARMKGWRTLSFRDSSAWLLHHRLMGSSDRSIIVGRLRWGRGIWFLGYHPLYALASALSRMREKPRVVGGVLILVGYVSGALGRTPQYDNPEFRRYLRRWQLGQLCKLLLSHVTSNKRS